MQPPRALSRPIHQAAQESRNYGVVPGQIPNLQSLTDQITGPVGYSFEAPLQLANGRWWRQMTFLTIESLGGLTRSPPS